MILSLTQQELKKYIELQISNYFPDKYRFQGSDIDKAFTMALERVEYCFKHISLPAYTDSKNTFFSHLHSDQYCQFLYFLSNSLWEISENKPICDKIILLNKTLNGMFFSYKAGLPDIFLLIHPIGTVIGNAKYSDFLVVLQNVTINTAHDDHGSVAPSIGKGVFLAAGAKIIGNKPVGDRVSIGVNTLVYNKEILSDSVVMCDDTGKICINNRKKVCRAQAYFNVAIE